MEPEGGGTDHDHGRQADGRTRLDASLAGHLSRFSGPLDHTSVRLLIVDLFPPGRHDPQGIHGAIWAAIDGVEAADFRLSPDRLLTLAAYEAKPAPTAYVEPIQLGAVLAEMPLFIEPGWYINVPLEMTYLAAWRGVPERWRRVIEGR